MTLGIEDNTAEQIAGRDIYNITSNNENELDTRPLVPAQRKSLHNLISDIESYGGVTARARSEARRVGKEGRCRGSA